MDVETPIKLEVGWLSNGTDSEGYVEVGLGWLQSVKRIIQILKDSVPLITMNRSLDGALEKLLTTKGSDNKNKEKETIDSLIAVQKGLNEVQYQFTKLAASLNQSSRTCLSLLNSKEAPADEGTVFARFLKNLNQQTLVELKEAYDGSDQANKSLTDIKSDVEGNTKSQRDGSFLSRMTRTQVILLGAGGCGVGVVVVSALQEHLGFSFMKSLVSVLVGAASIVFGLKMGGSQTVKAKDATESENSFEDVTCEAVLLCSNMKTQLEPIKQMKIDRDEKFYDSVVGHSFVECLEKIESVSGQYLAMSEANYGSLTDRNLCEDSATEE